MGYNTTVFILNDQLDQIRRDPADFVERLYHSIVSSDTGVYVPGQTTVMPTAHMDVHRLYSTHGNSIIELSKFSQETRKLAKRNPELVLERIRLAEQELQRLRVWMIETDDE